MSLLLARGVPESRLRVDPERRLGVYISMMRTWMSRRRRSAGSLVITAWPRRRASVETEGLARPTAVFFGGTTGLRCHLGEKLCQLLMVLAFGQRGSDEAGQRARMPIGDGLTC